MPPDTAARRVAIVPALDEERSIGGVIDEIRAYDPGFEIVVVDDGSRDGTAAVASAKGVPVLRLPYNLGIGGAVQTGFRYAHENGFGLAVQIDGDGQHDPQQIDVLLAELERTGADVVIGSRFLGEGAYRSPVSRKLGIKVFAWLISLVIGQRVTDTSSSFRACGPRAIELFAADYPHGFLETVEATAVASRSGLRIVEVPAVVRERAFGRPRLTGSLSLVYAVKVCVAVFVALFRRPLVSFKED